MTEPSLPELEAERDRLYAQLRMAGDFRRGPVRRTTASAAGPAVPAPRQIIPGTGRGSCGPGQRGAAGRSAGSSRPGRWRRCAARSAGTRSSRLPSSRSPRSARRHARPARWPERRRPRCRRVKEGALRRARGTAVRRDSTAGYGPRPGHRAPRLVPLRGVQARVRAAGRRARCRRHVLVPGAGGDDRYSRGGRAVREGGRAAGKPGRGLADRQAGGAGGRGQRCRAVRRGPRRRPGAPAGSWCRCRRPRARTCSTARSAAPASP
jgi:hypothetical protein